MSDNFDLRKYLIENKVTTNSRMLTEQVEDTTKIKDFVHSHPEYESLSPRELAKKVQEYEEEWERVSGNYSSIEDYFDEVENRGDFLQEDEVIDENREGIFAPFPVLLDFVDGDSHKALDAYETLGFKVEIDDEVNDVYSVTMEFKGYDWMAVLAILEDCKREGVRPAMLYNKDSYTFEEAMQLADEKAADDSYDGGEVGTKLYFLDK